MEDQTPEVVLSPQKLKYNLALWIVVGFATLATGVGIGLAMGKYFQPASSTTSASTIIPSPNPFPTKIPMKESDPTANWKMYTNEDFGFSFSYPKELTYLYDHLKGGNILLQNFDGSSPRKELDSDFQMVITANDTNGKLLEDYPKQWETELGKLPTETILVGGTTAIKGFSGQKYQAVPTVWFSKNATTFMAQLSHPKSTNKIWFDQILSTFKFVGQSGDQDIDDIFNKIRMTDLTIRWDAVTTIDTFRYPAQNGADLPVQKISFTATGKEDFNKVNKIVDVLKGDGWELDNNGSASGVGASYESYVKNIKGATYLLVFGFNNSNIWFAMSKI